MKNKTPYELLLFFHSGYTVSEIIKRGYKRSTVYKYRKVYEEALKKYRDKKL